MPWKFILNRCLKEFIFGSVFVHLKSVFNKFQRYFISHIQNNLSWTMNWKARCFEYYNRCCRNKLHFLPEKVKYKFNFLLKKNYALFKHDQLTPVYAYNMSTVLYFITSVYSKKEIIFSIY